MLTYDELRAAYPQESTVEVVVGGQRRTVEVVGHKAERLLDGVPAVRVYVIGYGTKLYSEAELKKFAKKKGKKKDAH